MNTFIRSRGGWIGSGLPDGLRAVGHDVRKIGQGERILPADFNPIENAFAKFKSRLRRPPPELSRPWKQLSQMPSTPSHRKNAQTTSRPRDMVQPDRNLL
jgi:hypothetical protein